MEVIRLSMNMLVRAKRKGQRIRAALAYEQKLYQVECERLDKELPQPSRKIRGFVFNK